MVSTIHVFLHVVQPGELLPAHGALVTTLVQAPVVRILPSGAYLLSAYLTLVRVLTSMQALVLSKIASCYEALSAGVALVRPFPCMQSPVFCGRVAPSECLSAYVTDIRFLAGVCPVMISIFRIGLERLVASVALVNHLRLH